jgi:hypothetical protein
MTQITLFFHFSFFFFNLAKRSFLSPLTSLLSPLTPSPYGGDKRGLLVRKATCDAQRGGDSGQNRNNHLNDELPSVLFHGFSF